MILTLFIYVMKYSLPTIVISYVVLVFLLFFFFFNLYRLFKNSNDFILIDKHRSRDKIPWDRC